MFVSFLIGSFAGLALAGLPLGPPPGPPAAGRRAPLLCCIDNLPSDTYAALMALLVWKDALGVWTEREALHSSQALACLPILTGREYRLCSSSPSFSAVRSSDFLVNDSPQLARGHSAMKSAFWKRAILFCGWPMRHVGYRIPIRMEDHLVLGPVELGPDGALGPLALVYYLDSKYRSPETLLKLIRLAEAGGILRL